MQPTRRSPPGPPRPTRRLTGREPPRGDAGGGARQLLVEDAAHQEVAAGAAQLDREVHGQVSVIAKHRVDLEREAVLPLAEGGQRLHLVGDEAAEMVAELPVLPLEAVVLDPGRVRHHALPSLTAPAA